MVIYIGKLKLRLEYSFLLIIAFAYLSGNKNIIYLIAFSSAHEAAHILFLYLFGGRANEITVAFYGIGLKYEYNFSFIQELIFLLSGAAINLLLYILNIGKEINLMLALINLIPIYPLDGGRALKLILNKCFALDISDKILKCLTAIILLSLIGYSIYSRSISFLLIAVYIIIYSINNPFE